MIFIFSLNYIYLILKKNKKKNILKIKIEK